VVEHYLRILDPSLCQHLEGCFVQSQLYGLRWARLLLGREFEAPQLFLLWDFLFAACWDAEHGDSEALLDEDAPLNVYSVLASVRMAGHTKRTNKDRRALYNEEKMKKEGIKFSYVCSPLLGVLADFMLAMLLQVPYISDSL